MTSTGASEAADTAAARETRGMRGMRVLVVLGTASGGTARHAGMLAEGCRQAGLVVSALGPDVTRDAFRGGVAAMRPDNSKKQITARTVPADNSKKTGGSPGRQIDFGVLDISDRPRPAHDIAVLTQLRRLLRRASPDVVHAHGVRAGAFAALALALIKARERPALVVTVHNAPPGGRAAGAVFGALELICARRAGAVLCASADLAARMRRRGAAAEEFDVPAPPAPRPDPEAVARARKQLGPEDRPVVLAVGRLAEQKGFDTLVAAAARWRGRADAPLLAIAGTGPLAGELAGQAQEAGVDLVLLGERDDVPALLAAAAVVVVPSRWEARALVVQEAMRAGAPVVASRVGGIPELTGEDAAVLVPPGEPGPLADAVRAVLDDAGLRDRLSAAGLARAAALPSPADAVRAVLAVYRRAPRPPASG